MFNKSLGTFLTFWGIVNMWCPVAEEVGAALFTAINLDQEGSFDQEEKALQLLDQAIEEKLNLNVRNGKGETLLNYALANDTDVALTLLRRANIDVNAANAGEKQRWTPLHVAVGAGTLKFKEDVIIDDILTKNPKINARDETNATPLHYAAAYAYGSIVEKLIDRGALINAVDENWCTPLHWAAFYASVFSLSSAKALLYRHADVDSRDREMRTPLHLAARVGSVEMVELLLNYGADINAIDLDKNTPLHRAVLYNHKEAAKVLAARGADTQLKNWLGYTPFELEVGSKTREEYDEKEKEAFSPVSAIPNRKKSHSPQAEELSSEKSAASSLGDEELPSEKRNNSPQPEELPKGKKTVSFQCDEELPSKKAKVE